MNLTQQEIQTLQNALTVAAEVYRKDALAVSNETLNTQFTKQAFEALELRQRLENADDVILEGEDS